MRVSTGDVGRLDNGVSARVKPGVGARAGGRSDACREGELCATVINGLEPEIEHTKTKYPPAVAVDVPAAAQRVVRVRACLQDGR
jgi:hypothetical protein